MNWLDWLFIGFLVLSILNGFREGFVRMGIGMMALIVGFLGASWFTGTVAGSLIPYVHSRPVAYLIGFHIIFVGVLIAGSLLGLLLARMLKIIGLSWIDRMLGGAFGVVRGLIIVVVIALAVTTFAPKSLPRAVQGSRFAPYVFGAARVLTELTPYEIREGFNRAYKDLKGLWEEALHRKPSGKPL